jgi:hypothetical protein
MKIKFNPDGNPDSIRKCLLSFPFREIGGKWYFREVDETGETTDSFEFLRKVK